MTPAASYVVQVILGDTSVERAIAVVDALTDSPHGPTHWGPVPRVRKRFDRAALAEACARARRDALLPFVLRTRPPRYQCLLHVAAGTPMIRLESELDLGTEDPPAYFELGLAIARHVPVEFGLVEPSFVGGYGVRDGHPDPSLIYAPNWRSIGPHRVYARTIFGSRILELLGGVETVAEAGMEIVEHGRGALVADVLHEPWTSAADGLWEAIVRATLSLHGTGVFARQVGPHRHEPGVAWSDEA